MITNRIYLLSTNLPRATTRYPIAKISMDIIEYACTIKDLRSKNNVTIYGDYITIIKRETLFNITMMVYIC